MIPRIRALPEDFVVDEIPLYPAIGEGAHTFLQIEKRLRTTEELAADLAAAAGVAKRDVGYAGRKDRLAVTRQWFSVPDLDPKRAMEFELPNARILDAVRHRNRLRVGHLRGNRFAIEIRDLDADRATQAKEKLDEILVTGLPNRFGTQRFGRNGSNPERARQLLARPRRIRDRRAARFLLSALQSEVFNRVLQERPLPLDRLEFGDVAIKHESGGAFLVEDPDRENERAAAFEISPTGPIFGKKVIETAAAPLGRETDAMTACGIPDARDLQLPPGIRLRGARRALRVLPTAVQVRQTGDTMLLRFELPAGSYATVLLEELFGALQEGPREI